MHGGDLGDHIGMESCVDMEADDIPSSGGGSVNQKPCRRLSTSAKKLPPPLPVQTSTVMKKYYTDDRRLVIKEEKVESPKFYFTSHRSNGRLTLRLLPSDSFTSSEFDDYESESASTDGGRGKCFSSSSLFNHQLPPVHI